MPPPRAPSRHQPVLPRDRSAPPEKQETGEDAYWVTPGRYLEVLDLVAGRDDVRMQLHDGNRSKLVHGLPGLVDRGLTAEFFLIASRLDQTGSLGAGDVGKTPLARDVHRFARDAPPVVACVRGPARWRRSSCRRGDVLSEVTGRPVDTAACPLGLYDRRVLWELRRRGYRRVMTSDRAAAAPRSWLQPRFSIRHDDTAESVAFAARPAGRRPPAAGGPGTHHPQEPALMSRPRVLVGFAESLAAVESIWNLLDHGFEVVTFGREGQRPKSRSPTTDASPSSRSLPRSTTCGRPWRSWRAWPSRGMPTC